MKGTFISSDYVKARDNSIRFIEANTDTIVYDDILDVEFSWQPLIDFISGSYDTLHIIHKPEIHYNSVKNLKSKVQSQLPSMAISESTAKLFDLVPPAVEDASNKFILRMAYDGGAIVDSEYCADSFNALTLMAEANHADDVIPFYGISGSTTFNTINTASYSSNVPNAVIKYKSFLNNDVGFHQVTDWPAKLTSIGTTDTKYISSFEISDESISDNVAWSYRNYAITYGSDLDSIDLGTAIKYAEFSLPNTSQINFSSISENTYLGPKHYYEYSTSTIKAQGRRAGLYNTETFLSGNNEAVALTEVSVGQVLKSFYVEGMPDTDDPAIYYNYEIAGKTWPAGSQITGSVVQSDVVTFDNNEGLIIGLKVSGAANPVYLGPNTSILSYHSSSNNIKFRALSTIDEDDVYFVNTDNSIVDILENKMIVLNDPTGSFTTLDVETADNVVVGDTPMFYFSFHNKKCFMPGAKVTMEDGSLKAIEDVKVGDSVATKDGPCCLVEDTYVYNVEQMTKMYTNGNITVTDSHPLYINGEWSNAEKLGWDSKVMYVKNLHNIKTQDNFILEGIPASGTTHNELKVTKDSNGYTTIQGDNKIANSNLL